MLQANTPAPAFEGIDQDGKTIRLADFAGKKLVIFFYPADNTPTCTTESCNLRDNYALLKSQGFEVVGVSPDGAKKHQNFISKYKLPYPLIADTEHAVMNAFGVWGPKKFMGMSFNGVHRTTFVISETGMIERVFDKVKAKEHAEQILASYA
jgi:peroxiredoxin Q/BCP